jgi:predicted acetyltransferase
LTDDRVTLDPIAHSQAAILESLLQLYAHDFSELTPVELTEGGRFAVPLDSRWFTEPAHHPFFVRRGGRLCGFALVRRGSRLTGDAQAMDVAEFFIARGVRRQGVGKAAVRALLELFPGRWEIRIRANNVAAREFWRRALAPATPSISQVEVDGVAWEVLQLSHATERQGSAPAT